MNEREQEMCCVENCERVATVKRGGDVYFPFCERHDPYRTDSPVQQVWRPYAKH